MVIHTITVNGVEWALSAAETVLTRDLGRSRSGSTVYSTLATLYRRKLVDLAKISYKVNTAGLGCKLLLLLKQATVKENNSLCY